MAMSLAQRRKIATKKKKMKFTGEPPSKLLYLGVGMIALLKDILDYAGVGSLPAIGYVVTLCFSFLIWILLAVFDRSTNSAKMNIRIGRQIARGLLIIFVALVEAFGFGLNFLPFETAMVIVLYIMANRAYKKAKKEHEEQVKQEAEQGYVYA